MRRPAGADPVLLALVLAGLLMVPLFLGGLGGDAVSWTLQTAIDGLNVWFAWRLANHPAVPRHGRRFWLAVIAACASCAVGDGFQTLLTYAHPGAELSVVQTACVVAGMTIAVVATLRHPLGGTGWQRLRLWLDAATVLTGVAAFLWYFLLAGRLTGGREATERWGAAATAVVMLLIAFGLLKLIFSGTAPFARSAGWLGALGLAGTALSSSLGSVIPGGDEPRVLYLLQLLPCVAVAASLRLQLVLTRPVDPARSVVAGQYPSRLPYLAVIATQVLVVVALQDGDPDLRVWGVAIGAVAITALVLARQLSAVRDNDRLLSELDEQREWFRALVQHTSDLTMVVDHGGVIRYASPAAERVLGTAPELLAGSSLDDRTHPDDLPAVVLLGNRLTANPGVGIAIQLRWRHADASYRWLDVICTDLFDNPSIRGVVLNARDATESRALHDELRRQADHDSLTGLANRALLHRRFAEVTDADGRVSVLLIDLDGFKQINDEHGHHAGDLVLTAVAERLTGLLGVGETAARLGGDEFAVLLPGTTEEEAANLAGRIAVVLAEPMLIAGAWLTVGASVGVAGGGAGDGERVLREADAAMYRRKHARKQRA
ncbi:diguanylate cyclase [Actinoplanes sp. NPDC051851]|uniref:diguanylate cyclase domain-containing protein n=1 Tax=Actinoplanes sp. NPDC051851 TaxID=3154753 RepID=UPI00342058B6